jgi:hypothetical protein
LSMHVNEKLSEPEITILTRFALMENGGINIREADKEYGMMTMVGLCSKGWLSLLCETVLLDDAYYCLSSEGRVKLPTIL